jgi:DNA-binding SARP family transcriptional activator/Tfp pilus assembly protein PilF
MQPHPQELGLLARLAMAGERGLSRDKLVGCFWPDKAERRALHSLSQALHAIKRDVGVPDLFLGTRILRLNPAQMSSDVGELEVALRAGAVDRAVGLYAGPFLDGLSFDGTPEFERWVESERHRLSDAYAKCLRDLATGAAAVGDQPAAADWWQRLAKADPLDSGVALELVRALDAAGDHTAARREARLHETLVRTELHAAPDARIQDLIDSDPTEGQHRRADSKARREQGNACSALTTDELCARGRQCIHSFTAESFAEGARYLERALALDPRHAEAHVTLGSLYVLLSQVTRDGNPRARGVALCRRAAELDPQLAEVLLWLACAADLDERFEEAETLALRGVALDPVGHFTHYVLAWVLVKHGLRTGRWDKCAQSAAAFARALELHPRDPHALMGLSSLYAINGQYNIARDLLENAVEVERSPGGEMRMIAARTLLGLVESRQGQMHIARASLEQALRDYTGAPQLFAPYVNALTLCGLGDLERWVGRYDEAVAHYTRARALLEPVPALIGAGYLVVRLETRLAGAFRRLRMRREEQRYAGAARAITATREPYSFTWCWFVSEGELHYDWAVYHATCGDRNAMLDSLRTGARYGWREVPLLDLEPGFAFCRNDPALQDVRDEVHRMPKLPEHW